MPPSSIMVACKSEQNRRKTTKQKESKNTVFKGVDTGASSARIENSEDESQSEGWERE